MRIHMWTADMAGSGWYRGHLPGMALNWLGHQVSVGPRLPADWQQLDAVVGCRVAKPAPSQMWERMRERGVRLVLDLDDDYFHLDPLNRVAYDTWTEQSMRDGLLRNIRLADAVTVVSERLAAVLREHHPDVRVIPNGLPAQYLGLPRDYEADGRPLAVGWAGTSSTIAELPLAARALTRIAEYPRPGGAQVRLVGVTAKQAIERGMRGGRVGALGWVDRPEHYIQAVAGFDVWVAPYRDIPFNQAKFPTKALEAGFLGVPLVASAVGAYTEAVRHGETGFLVPPGREHLFGRYLKQLADDPGLRRRMGEAARAQASGSILQALNQRWQDALTAPAKEAAT